MIAIDNLSAKLIDSNQLGRVGRVIDVLCSQHFLKRGG